MLPSHGTAFSVFLLANSARYTAHANLQAWIDAARARTSYLAAAADIETPARNLVVSNLAAADSEITVAPQLLALGERGDRATLISIARLLLAHCPPTWLPIAVTEREVRREYIPDRDLQALEWLEPELDAILLDAFEAMTVSATEAFRQQLGDAAELLLMAVFLHAGKYAVHVSRISDAYGYDIEIRDAGSDLDRIEVKAAGPSTRGVFHLTRNEFEKSRTHGTQWRLLQVVFNSGAFVTDRITGAHVVGIYELAVAELQPLVPADTPAFKWTDSALITAPAPAWRAIDLVVPPAFGAPIAGPVHAASARRRHLA